jgi:Fe-S-cluster-containing dehydrogenase component
MPRLGFLIDVTKCTGCYNCFLACRDEYCGNEYPGYSAAQPTHHQFWMQITEIERGTYPHPKVDYLAVPCQHCENPTCAAAAIDGAVYTREDGMVMIDPEKAKGQKDIVNSCPYRVIYWNEELQVPQKCTGCSHMIDADEKEPRCVESCPTSALIWGDLDDPNSEIAKTIASKPVEFFHPEYGTSPRVFYVGIPKRMVTGEVILGDKSGECAQGVKVTLMGEGFKLETLSDTFGDFEFEGIDKNKPVKVSVEAAGYAPQDFQVVTNTDVNLGEIVLERLS